MLADRPGGSGPAAIGRFAQGFERGFRPGRPARRTRGRGTRRPRAAARAARRRGLHARGAEGRGRRGPARAAARSSACSAAATPPASSRSGPAFRRSQMLRIRRLLGLPEPSAEDRVFGEEEIDAAKSISLFLESGFGEESIAEITRVLGEGMARLAATTVGRVRRGVPRAGRQRGRGGRAVRDAGRAADPRDRSGAARGVQAASRRERPARDARPRRARVRRGRRRPGDRRVLRRHGRVHAASAPRSRPRSWAASRAGWPSSRPT